MRGIRFFNFSFFILFAVALAVSGCNHDSSFDKLGQQVGPQVATGGGGTDPDKPPKDTVNDDKDNDNENAGDDAHDGQDDGDQANYCSSNRIFHRKLEYSGKFTIERNLKLTN